MLKEITYEEFQVLIKKESKLLKEIRKVQKDIDAYKEQLSKGNLTSYKSNMKFENIEVKY